MNILKTPTLTKARFVAIKVCFMSVILDILRVIIPKNHTNESIVESIRLE